MNSISSSSSHMLFDQCYILITQIRYLALYLRNTTTPNQILTSYGKDLRCFGHTDILRITLIMEEGETD